jgi:superfamily I DNA/RNA helicase/DNA polymerase III epsilon subunit-like protein
LATLVPSPAQAEAITAPLGPVLVLAGPGAGKTFCLIQRIRHLVEERGFEPSRIVAVTFTNRAAGEIASRLASVLGDRAEAVTRGTIHALCVQLLREHGEEAGVPKGFGIADEEYQLQALRRAGFYKEGQKWPLTRFSRHRLTGEPLGDWLTPIYERYRAHLAKRNLLDFDDLIASTEVLLRTREATATRIAARWDYLLIDEAQDLTPAQYRVLSRLARDHRNIFVVGDDEQSIFGFAGADSTVLTTFINDHRITRSIVLDENRRCSRQIFDAARRLISRNPREHHKDLRALRESPWEVSAGRFADEEEEAGWLIADLEQDRAAHGHAWGEVALLYRRHETGDLLEARLVQAGIPCQLATGRALADDPIVGYLIAALRVVDRPDDPYFVEQFAAVHLPPPLMATLRADAAREKVEFPEWLRREGRRLRPHPDVDGKKVLRCLANLANLPGLTDRFTALTPLVEHLLSHKVGPYRVPLEDKFEESLLTDPLADPAAGLLATSLAGARHGRKRVWLPSLGGAEFGIAGMLRAAGVTTIGFVAGGEAPDPSDVVIEPAARGALSLAGTVFKALQAVEGRELRPSLTDYVAVDVETNELDRTRCEVVDLAGVRVRGGKIVEEFQSLVRPTRPISAATTKVHGITDADVAGAPPFAEAWRAFRAFAGDDQLVAHNGHDFDFPVLRRLAEEMGNTWTFSCYDTLPLARDIHPGSKRLGDLAHAYGIDTGRAHRALDDCRTLAQVVYRLEEERLRRARTIGLGHLLDHLAVALALTDTAELNVEDRIFFELGRIFALGRYTRALASYEAERTLAGAGESPDVEHVIGRLGGRELMARIQREKSASDRYPATMARLRSLLASLTGTDLREQLAEFLARVALSTSTAGAETSANRVNLLTLHATKGLEFSRVYVVGVEDGQLPGSAPGKRPGKSEIEDGRRLLYVGMTRARDRLVLTRVERRRGVEAGGSIYLEEIGLG